jgi:uncharacterized protein YjdB
VTDVQWSSSDPAVARVDANGFVQSVGAGTAIISARSVQGGLQAVCVITVEPVRVTDIALNTTESALAVGQTAQLSATISPENATNKTVNWISANNAIATVDQNGLVTAHSVGVIEIVATTEDDGFVAKSVVTVTNLVTSIELSHERVEVIGGEQVSLEATALPLDATNRSITWSTSNPSIAEVDENNMVATVPVASATNVVITATANDGSGVSVSAEIVVIPVPIQLPEIPLPDFMIMGTPGFATGLSASSSAEGQNSEAQAVWDFLFETLMLPMMLNMFAAIGPLQATSKNPCFHELKMI